jgi:uncharacterized membrane protein YeaQ/YmgE (transglycosylase-associated protein family)
LKGRSATDTRLRYHLEMFPISPVVMVISLVVYALAGMAIGALTGWLTSLITKCGQKGLLKDGFLGSFGHLAGFIGSISVPWPRNTITYRLEGGTEVSSTMNSYQHPERVAIAIAILLPLLRELYLCKKRKASQLT